MKSFRLVIVLLALFTVLPFANTYAETQEVNSATSHYQKGLQQLKANQYDEAIKAFKLAITLQPSDYRSYHSFGYCLLQTQPIRRSS